MGNNTVRLTAKGQKEIQDKIQKLEQKIGKLHDSIEKAIRQFGVHDDHYYERLELKKIAEQERSHLLALLANSKTVGEHKKHTKVDIGCRVTLVNEGLQSIYQVVETFEANPIEGRVSVMSPLGKSLIGKRMGDLVKMVSPSGVKELTIAAIS